jgi:hypothetical protein
MDGRDYRNFAASQGQDYRCRLFALLSDGSVRRGLRWPEQLVVYNAVNLIAYAFYIAATLLFYYMLKPVNRSLSCSRRSSASWDAPRMF